MTESEGGITGILRFLKDARTALKEADSFADDAEGIISKHKNAIIEVFGEFLPEIGSRADGAVQTLKVADIKSMEEELLVDVFTLNNTINVIVSSFANQPEVELNEDSKSITIHYDEKAKLIRLPCTVEYKDKYLFEWNNSNEKIIDVLKDEFNIDWLDEAKVKTTEKIKYIYKGKQHKLSILIDETDKATLSIDNERVFNLKLERDKDKIKVYRDSYTFVNGVLNLLFMKEEEKK